MSSHTLGQMTRNCRARSLCDFSYLGTRFLEAFDLKSAYSCCKPQAPIIQTFRRGPSVPTGAGPKNGSRSFSEAIFVDVFEWLSKPVFGSFGIDQNLGAVKLKSAATMILALLAESFHIFASSDGNPLCGYSFSTSESRKRLSGRCFAASESRKCLSWSHD